MAGMTTFFSDKVLNMMAAGAFPTVTDVPGTLYVALLTTNPSADDMTGAVEAAFTNYVRASIVSTAVGWNAPSGTAPRSISNKLSLNFGTAGSGPTTITGFAICVHSSAAGGAVTVAGEVLYWNVLTGGNKVVNNGDPTTAAAGGVVITQD